MQWLRRPDWTSCGISQRIVSQPDQEWSGPCLSHPPSSVGGVGRDNPACGCQDAPGPHGHRLPWESLCSGGAFLKVWFQPDISFKEIVVSKAGVRNAHAQRQLQTPFILLSNQKHSSLFKSPSFIIGPKRAPLYAGHVGGAMILSH